MNDYIADTVALILRLEQRQMGARARAIFADVEAGNASLYVPAMVLAEILYLSERKRIQATLADVRSYMNRYPLCKEQPLSFAMITTAQMITDIPELHDRLIAATAVYLQLPLIYE
ncbi:MAG: PIN domain-containing protein [Caldilineaceae bacterium]